MDVTKEDNDVIYVEGVIDGVNVHVDFEDAACYVRAEHDVAFVLVEGGDKVGPYLKAMQGYRGMGMFAQSILEQTVGSP